MENTTIVIKFKKPCYKCPKVKPICDERTAHGGFTADNIVIIYCDHDQVCGMYLNHKEDVEYEPR